MVANPDARPLSPAERAVFRLLMRGADDAAIAGALFISIATVREHIRSIRRKLGAAEGSRRGWWITLGRAYERGTYDEAYDDPSTQ